MPVSLFAFKYRLTIVPLSLLSEGGIVPECLRKKRMERERREKGKRKKR